MPVDLTTLLNPSSTAVVTMEVQRGVAGDLSALPDLAAEMQRRGTITAIARLVAAARGVGARVVHCTVEFRADHAGSTNNAPLLTALSRHPGGMMIEGTPAVEVVPELGPDAADIIERRRHGISPFGGTSLDATLRNLGVTTVLAVGGSVNLGIFGLCIEAVNHGFRVALPTDAVAGVPADYAQAVISNSLALIATLTTVDDVLRSWGVA